MNVGRNNMPAVNTGKPAVLIFVLIALIVITPLCGYLFSCGCTWPGAGLEANCNYYDMAAKHHCPWCVSIIAGGLSVGLSILAGYFITTSDWFSRQADAPAFNLNFVRISAGLGVFILVAFITGLVSAKIQGYPTFLLGL